MQKQSQKTTKSDAEILRYWLDFSVSRDVYNKALKRMVEKCLVPKYTIRNWRYGVCRIPMSAKRDINEVTKEFSGIEIFQIVIPE